MNRLNFLDQRGSQSYQDHQDHLAILRCQIEDEIVLDRRTLAKDFYAEHDKTEMQSVIDKFYLAMATRSKAQTVLHGCVWDAR